MQPKVAFEFLGNVLRESEQFAQCTVKPRCPVVPVPVQRNNLLKKSLSVNVREVLVKCVKLPAGYLEDGRITIIERSVQIEENGANVTSGDGATSIPRP